MMGFMPIEYQYGFIFTSNTDVDNIIKTMAHELGHGAFNLVHTFADDAQYNITKYQSTNLMDYSTGTDLWKYQWDLIHNPNDVLLAFLQDEEDGAAEGVSYYETIGAKRICFSETLDGILLNGRNNFAFRAPDDYLGQADVNNFYIGIDDPSNYNIGILEHGDQSYAPYRGSIASIKIGDKNYTAHFSGTTYNFEFTGYTYTSDSGTELLDRNVVETESSVQLPFIKQNDDGKYYYRIASLDDLGSEDTDDKYKVLTDCNCYDQDDAMSDSDSPQLIATASELETINSLLKEQLTKDYNISNVYLIYNESSNEDIQGLLSEGKRAIAVDKVNSKTYIIGVTSIEGIEGTPYILQEILNLSFEQAIIGIEQISAINKAIADGLLTERKYWDVLDSDYSSIYYNFFAHADLSQLEFAGFCGMYDGLVSMVGELTETISIIAQAAKDPSAFKEMLEGLTNIQGMADAIVDAHTTDNEYELAHQVGEDIVIVATVVYAIKDLPAVAKNLVSSIKSNLKFASQTATKVFKDFSEALKSTLKKLPDDIIAELLDDGTILFRQGDEIIATRTPSGSLYSGEITNLDADDLATVELDLDPEADDFGERLSEYGDSGDLDAPTSQNVLVFSSYFIEHLTDVQGFSQKRAVTGGHNLDNFNAYLSSNNIEINRVSTVEGSVDGISELTYQIKKADGSGEWKSTQFKKTHYDPSKISDSEMVSYGKEAISEGLQANRTIIQEGSNTIIKGESSIGIKFLGYQDPTTGNILNFHPVINY